MMSISNYSQKYPIALVQEATEIMKRGKEIKEIVLGLQREERARVKGRQWKKNLVKLQQVIGFLSSVLDTQWYGLLFFRRCL